MRRWWIPAAIAALAVIAGVLIAAGQGSGTSPQTTTTTGAAGAETTTTISVAAAPTSTTAGAGATPTTAAISSTTAAGEPQTETDTDVATTTTTIAATTTTTTLPSPVDERLPRTSAAATETDPVPIGEVLEAEPGVWDIALTSVDLDATEKVLGFAEINPEPEPGYQDVLVTIEGTYLGDNVAQPVFEWAVIAGGKEYLPSIPGCGVLPDSLYDVVEALPGESFTAQVCMPVASEDVAGGLELYLNAPGDDPRYYSLG